MTSAVPMIDLNFALSQLGGNAKLLQRMLVKFQQEFKSVPMQVKHLLDEGNQVEAKMKVHTTKGISGNLGLLAIFECSKKLDQQIRDNNIADGIVDEFESLMQETCAEIENINLDVPAPQTAPSSFSNDNHKDIFLERLKRHEFLDDDTLQQYVNSLNMDSQEKSQLINLVEELQYAEAIRIIESSQ